MHLKKVISALVFCTLVSGNASAQDATTDAATIPGGGTVTTDHFSIGDLNPVSWGKDIEHDAESIGKDVANGAKKGLHILESLANPCKACKEALAAGIDNFACGEAAGAIVKQVEKCAAKVSETQPELAPESEVVCSALKGGVETACKKVLKKDSDLKSFQTKIVDKTCHIAHLCS